MKPFALDVRTDETAKTGTITIYAEAQGDSDALRDLKDTLLEQFPMDVFLRGDVRSNVPQPTPKPED